MLRFIQYTYYVMFMIFQTQPHYFHHDTRAHLWRHTVEGRTKRGKKKTENVIDPETFKVTSTGTYTIQCAIWKCIPNILSGGIST